MKNPDYHRQASLKSDFFEKLRARKVKNIKLTQITFGHFKFGGFWLIFGVSFCGSAGSPTTSHTTLARLACRVAIALQIDKIK